MAVRADGCSGESVADAPPPHGEAYPSRLARIAIYCQDGLGLGHMRRTNAIAGELLRTLPGSAVLTIQDSPLGNFFPTDPNHDYIKLPSIEKLGPGRWRAVRLPIPFEEVRRLRQDVLRSAIASFRPDVVLVDHMPHGAMGELTPALEELKSSDPAVAVVLGLRDILDAPKVIRARWQLEGAYEAIDRLYDLVLVYGSREVFDLARHYRLPAHAASKLRYCGYVSTRAGARGVPRSNIDRRAARSIVVVAGGGGDAFPMMRLVVESLPAVAARERVDVTMVTGPLMPAPERQRLVDLASDLPVRVRASVPDAGETVAAADLVVARAGYNSTVEILRAGVPALLIPRLGPSAEQRMRVRLFRDRGWIDGLAPGDLTPSTVAERLLRRLRLGPVEPPNGRPDLGGLQSAVRHLTSLIPGAAPAVAPAEA